MDNIAGKFILNYTKNTVAHCKAAIKVEADHTWKCLQIWDG